jgi:hypothetical protein
LIFAVGSQGIAPLWIITVYNKKTASGCVPDGGSFTKLSGKTALSRTQGWLLLALLLAVDLD